RHRRQLQRPEAVRGHAARCLHPSALMAVRGGHGGALSAGAPSTRPPDAVALDAFRAGFSGTVVVRGDGDYDRARVVWNGIADRHPAVVARCAGTADVVAALRFAREQDLV